MMFYGDITPTMLRVSGTRFIPCLKGSWDDVPFVTYSVSWFQNWSGDTGVRIEDETEST